MLSDHLNPLKTQSSDGKGSTLQFSVPGKVAREHLRHLPSFRTFPQAFFLSVQYRTQSLEECSSSKLRSLWLIHIGLYLWKGHSSQHRFYQSKQFSLILNVTFHSLKSTLLFFNLPMRSVGPVPRFSPLIVTFVHEMPSLGEMPVTSGGCRARDMMSIQLARAKLVFYLFSKKQSLKPTSNYIM